MGAITSVNAINAILKLVATEALTALMGTLVMGRLINRDFEPVMAAAGDTVNVPIAPSLVANNIAEGGTIQNQVASLGNAQVVLNTHAEASFQIGDIVKALTQQNLAQLYMDAAIKAIAERIETDIMSTYPLFTDNTAVGGAAPISETVVDDAETSLFLARVPAADPKYLVLNAASYSDCRQIQKFSEMNTVGQAGVAAIQEGVVGRIKGFNVLRSHFVQTAAGTTYNLAFARNALALVTRRLPQPLPGTGAIAEYAEMGDFGMRVVMSYAQQTLAQQFTIDCLFGVAALRNMFATQVLTNT